MRWRHLPRYLVRTLVWSYQRTLSPDHGPLRFLFPYGACRFHPTCSNYMSQAVMRFGVIRGVPIGVWRVLRCNPFSAGGHDPVPEKNQRRSRAHR